MGPRWGVVTLGVLLGGLLAGCAAGPTDGEVEVEGVVLEADETGTPAWRDGDGAPVEPPTAAQAPDDAADLADGAETGGLDWSVDGEGWVEVSSRVLDRSRPSLAADVLLVEGTGAGEPGDELRTAACGLILEAPADRGLRASGAIALELVVTDATGTRTTEPVARWDLDLGLAAGQRVTARTEPVATLERTAVSQVRCEATFSGD